MDKVGELVDTIVEKTEHTKAEILKRIKKKQSELSGLVSKEGAAYIVANELGIKTRNKVIEQTIKIKDIMPEMRSLSMLARVKRVDGPREFTSKRGTKGKVANLEVVDNTGSTRIVLWNMSDIEKVENHDIKVGDIVEVKNGYVRPGFREGLEVHIGNRGAVKTDLDDVNEDDFPSVDNHVVKIADIKPDQAVHVIGKVTNNYGVREFQKEDRTGKVGTLMINDGSGTTRLVLWNEKADLVEDIKEGDIVDVDNAYAKEGMRGIEIQANWATNIVKNPEGVKIDEVSVGRERVTIDKLRDGDMNKEVRAVVVNVFNEEIVHSMCPTCNKKLTEGMCEACGEVKNPRNLIVLNVLLDDGTGTIRGVLFDNAAAKLLEMKPDEVAENPSGAVDKLDAITGKECLFTGRVKMNNFTNAEELTVNDVNKADPVEEAEKIIKKSK